MIEPTSDEIERAWRRPQVRRRASPGSPDPKWAGAYLRWVERSMSFSFFMFLIFSIALTASSLADCTLKLGWGLGWREFWGSLILALGGGLTFGASKVILTFVRAVHQHRSA